MAVKFRVGTAQECLKVIGCRSLESASPTIKNLWENLQSGNAEFWTVENDEHHLIGELYIFHRLDDEDFANGKDRAYLCAFRIKKMWRGQGLGTGLITAVIEHLRETGCKTVTIGVDENEPDNQRLYHRLGFTQKIKDCRADPCDVDKNGKPLECPCFWLLSKSL